MFGSYAEYLTPEEAAALRAAEGKVQINIKFGMKLFEVRFEGFDELTIQLDGRGAAIAGMMGTLEPEIGMRTMAAAAKALMAAAGVDINAIMKRAKEARQAAKEKHIMADDSKIKRIFDDIMSRKADPMGDEPVA